MIIFAWILLGFGLSFISLGILWAGVDQWLQAVITLLFFISGYFLSRYKNAVNGILLGAVPIGGMLLLFRNKEGSHLLGMTIVISWFVALLIAARIRSAKKG